MRIGNGETGTGMNLVRPAGIEPTTFPRRKGALGTLSPKYANRKWRNRHRDELGATGGN